MFFAFEIFGFSLSELFFLFEEEKQGEYILI